MADLQTIQNQPPLSSGTQPVDRRSGVDTQNTTKEIFRPVDAKRENSEQASSREYPEAENVIKSGTNYRTIPEDGTIVSEKLDPKTQEVLFKFPVMAHQVSPEKAASAYKQTDGVIDDITPIEIPPTSAGAA